MQDLMNLPRRSESLILPSDFYNSMFVQVSAHYSADPYNMLDQLKKMNLKHVKVAYGGNNKNKTVTKKSEKKEDVKMVLA